MLRLVLIRLAILAVAQTVPTPMEEIRETIQKLKHIVSDPSLKSESKKKERRERIRFAILERIDISEMGRRALGIHWQARTETERREYLDVFGKYIESLYRKNIFESVEFIQSTNIRLIKERIDDNFAEVDLSIPSSPEDIKITFKLRLINNHWKAYDVIIVGISQVSNIRSQFNRIMNENNASPFQELLKRMRDKITD